MTQARKQTRAGSTRASQHGLGELVSRTLKSPMIDFYLVLVSAVLLIGMGLTMVLSASNVLGEIKYDDSYYFVKRQVIFLVAGAILAWFMARRPPGQLRFLGWAGGVLAMLLLIATFVPGLGVNVNGNRNWLQLGTSWLRIQPSEFAKLAMIVLGADVLARNQRQLTIPSKLLFPFVPFSLLLTLLVVMQQDLGTAMVMIAIMLGMLYVVGANWRILGTMIGGMVVVVVVMVQASSSRSGRLTAYLNPEAATPGLTEQVTRSMYALASGGWWGRGLGQSRQKWGGLAEAHTDFVFAILGEELGLVGTLLVLGLFAVLGAGGLRVALRSDQPFSRYCAAGVTLWFMLQASINIMVVLRLLPTLGVPLPFLSYGGSALLANLLALGVLLACARNEPAARRFEARRRAAPVPKPRVSSVVDTGRS